jgi:Kef-type K+ transport system membrane component KefB
LLMVGGFVAGSILDRLGLPRMAGYVAIGALMSEPLLGAFVPGAPGRWAETITTVALGVIAFLVGAEIDLARLRAEEREVASVVAGQAVGPILFVTLAIGGATALAPELFGGRIEWPVALVFAAIAAATASAGTMAVIEQYGARGPLTAMVLGLVAIDDAVSVAAFTVAAGLAADGGLSVELLAVGRELGLSLLAGGVLGLALGLFARHVHEGDLRLPPTWQWCS